MKCDALVRNFVRRAHRGRTGVVIIKFPEDKTAVGLGSAAYVNYARRTEIRPGKFLFTRPDQLHGFSGSFRQARRFDSRFASVLASVGRARIRHNHANAFRSEVKSMRKFFDDCKRALSSRPHRRFAIFPFRDSGPWLQRGVRDIGNRISLLQRLRGLSARLLDRSQYVLLLIVAFIWRSLSQM